MWTLRVHSRLGRDRRLRLRRFDFTRTAGVAFALILFTLAIAGLAVGLAWMS